MLNAGFVKRSVNVVDVMLTIRICQASLAYPFWLLPEPTDAGLGKQFWPLTLRGNITYSTSDVPGSGTATEAV